VTISILNISNSSLFKYRLLELLENTLPDDHDGPKRFLSMPAPVERVPGLILDTVDVRP
jgi:hypothetical protein